MVSKAFHRASANLIDTLSETVQTLTGCASESTDSMDNSETVLDAETTDGSIPVATKPSQEPPNKRIRFESSPNPGDPSLEAPEEPPKARPCQDESDCPPHHVGVKPAEHSRCTCARDFECQQPEAPVLWTRTWLP